MVNETILVYEKKIAKLKEEKEEDEKLFKKH